MLCKRRAILGWQDLPCNLDSFTYGRIRCDSMDGLLSTYHEKIDCLRKETFCSPTGEKIKLFGEKQAVQFRVISSLKLELCCLRDVRASLPMWLILVNPASVLIAFQWFGILPTYFHEELPGVMSDQDIEFTIELVPGASPISIVPYRMAPVELLELKV